MGVGQSEPLPWEPTPRGENPGRLGRTSGARISPASSHPPPSTGGARLSPPSGPLSGRAAPAARGFQVQVVRTWDGEGRDPFLLLSRNRDRGLGTGGTADPEHSPQPDASLTGVLPLPGSCALPHLQGQVREEGESCHLCDVCYLSSGDQLRLGRGMGEDVIKIRSWSLWEESFLWEGGEVVAPPLPGHCHSVLKWALPATSSAPPPLL